MFKFFRALPWLLVFVAYLLMGFCDKVRADELWETTGMWSHHNNEDHYHYQQDNTGAGLSYRTSPQLAWVGGEYTNSLRHDAVYLGALYTPYHVGDVGFGAIAGMVSGYTHTPKFVMALIPAASYEYHSVGINLVWMPSIVVAVQFKFKMGGW